MLSQAIVKKILRVQHCGAHLRFLTNKMTHNVMPFAEVVSRLKQYAPLSLAESWDNVGVLVEPSSKEHVVKVIMLTNDLTEGVIDEAIVTKTDMVISYHPPIFTPLKRLSRDSWKTRVLLKAVENKIAIYSPHTAFDAMNGGVNDWLASNFGKASITPLKPALSDVYGTKRVSVSIPEDIQSKVDQMIARIKQVENVVKVETEEQGGTGIQLHIACHANSLSGVINVLNHVSPSLLSNMNITELSKVPNMSNGVGRLCTLDVNTPLQAIIALIKTNLNLTTVRVAPAYGRSIEVCEHHMVKTIAICAGSGASVLRGVKADVYLTGEMSHHDILDAVQNGIHVILCEHSNTERGFLIEKFQSDLYAMLDGKVTVLVSEVDVDPLVVT